MDISKSNASTNIDINLTNNKSVDDDNDDFKTHISNESIGNVEFYKCLQCSYMALSNKDMRFHMLTLHISLNLHKSNKLIDNVMMKCPGCVDQYFTEVFMKSHLHSHHKMSAKDIGKIIVSLKKEIKKNRDFVQNMEVVIDDRCFESNQAGETKSVTHVVETPNNVSTVYQFLKTKSDAAELSSIKVLNSEISDHNENEISSNTLKINEQCNFNTNTKVEPHNNSINLFENLLLSQKNNENESTHVSCLENIDTLNSKCVSSDVVSNNYEKNIPATAQNKQKKTFVNYRRKPILLKAKHSRIGRPSGSKTLGISKFRKVSDESYVSKTFGFKCNIKDCGVRLNLEKNISYHKSCHLNGNKELYCPECKKHYMSVEALHTHLWKQHHIDIELHSCDQCPYRVYSLNRLNNVHKKIHSDEKNYSCEVCSKAFKNSKQLANHRAIHRKKEGFLKKFSCNICKRELSTRTLLSVHLKTVHEKSKLYQCKRCSYSSSLKSSLVLHMRSHTGEKPYACSECNFKSANCSSLRRHEMRHTQQRTYKCEHCSYSCIQASSIKTHIKIKHPGVKTDLLNSCQHCTYTSVNKSNYLAHLNTHNVYEQITEQSINEEIDDSNEIEIPESIQLVLENDENVSLSSPNNLNSIYEDFCSESAIKNKIRDILKTDTNNLLKNGEFIDSQNPSKKLLISVNNNIADETFNCLIEGIHNDINLNNEAINFTSESYENASNKLSTITNNKPIFVRNIVDMTNSKPMMIKNTAFKSDSGLNDKKQINSNFPIILIQTAQNIIQSQNVINQDGDQNYDDVKSDYNDQTSSLLDFSLKNSHSTARKKPKIYVKSNLILKGPNNSFNQNSFVINNFSSENQSLDDSFPLNLETNLTEDYIEANDNAFTIDNLGADDFIQTDSNHLDLDRIAYDPFHSNNFNYKNFAFSTNETNMTDNMQNSTEDKQYDLDNLLPDDVHQISIGTIIKNKSYDSFQAELGDIDSSGCIYLEKDLKCAENPTLYQLPFKFETKIDTLSNSFDIPIFNGANNFEEFPCNYNEFNDMDIHQFNNDMLISKEIISQMATSGEVITVDETSCDIKSLSVADPMLNFIGKL